MQAREDGRPCIRPALPPILPEPTKVITDVLALWPAAGYCVLLVGPCASVQTLAVWNELRTPSQTTTVYCKIPLLYMFGADG